MLKYCIVGSLLFILVICAVLAKSSRPNIPDCSTHPIYCHILDLKNERGLNISHSKAMRLSNVIYKEKRQCDINPRLIVAIIMQESRFKVDSVSKITGYNENNNRQTIKIDFGIMQINFRNIEKYKLNVKRLLVDEKYSIQQGVKILCRFKKKYLSFEPNSWYSRYHHSNSILRRQYNELISRYL